jgi:hypothetical protein
MNKICSNNNCIRKGFEYDDSYLTCPLCEQVLSSSTEMATYATENTQIETATLVDLDHKPIEISLDGCIIGRSSTLGDGVFNHKWVSDPHCRLFIQDGILFVEDIGDSQEGSTNGTSINGEERIAKKTPHPLADKDRLTIAHLKFDVEIKNMQVQNPDIIEETLIWTVICPECGKWHEVADSSKRISNCDGCDDQSYAKEISKAKATQRRETDWKLRE